MPDEYDEPTLEDVDDEVASPAKPTNQLERLKELRRKRGEERRPLDLAIPGYEDQLIARYRVLDHDKVEKLKRRVRKMVQAQDDDAELKGAMDTIAAACVGMFVRQEDGSLKPMNECPSDLELGDEPIRYDERLAEVLGIDSEGKVRTLIFQMFGEEGLIIENHFQRIDAWMSGVNEDDDEDF
jgi:hypothetical protein